MLIKGLSMVPAARRGRLGLLAAVVALSLGDAVQAQTAGAWFGLPAPGPATGQVLDFSTADLPMIAAPSVGANTELLGATAHGYVADIVGFAEESRRAGDATWGRLASSPWTAKAVDYVEGHFRTAGLKDIVRAPALYAAPQTIATAWKVTLTGRPEYGPGTADVDLRSAFPMDATPEGGALAPGASPPKLGIASQSVTAPLLYLGGGTPAELASADVRGKIAVLRFEPASGIFFTPLFRTAQQLITAGAAGVLLVYDAPGNMQTHFGSCAGGPCFVLGGEDGQFLNAAIARAAKAGAPALQATLSLTTETKAGEQGVILIGKVPGRSGGGENLIISAHSDSWFGGADDNASGMAALIALAHHYAKGARPAHDIYFILSPGHHSPTGSLRAFIALHPDVPPANILTINLEHVGQQATVRSYFNAAGGMGPSLSKYGQANYTWEPANGDSPGREISGSPMTPALKRLIAAAAQRAQFVAPSRLREGTPGELPAIVAAGATAIQDVETSMWYHTSGDTAETIAPEALQRAMLFYKAMLDTADRMTRAQLRAPAP